MSKDWGKKLVHDGSETRDADDVEFWVI